MKMYNPLAIISLLFSVALLSACASTELEAITDHDSAFDFTKVYKIAIQPVKRMNAAAIQISDMDVNRLNRILTDQLIGKGFEVVEDNADADMYLSWHLVTQEKTDVRSYNSASYYNCWRCGPTVSDISVRQYTEGMLIVDMIDPTRGQSVWRGTVQSKLSSKEKPEESDALRHEAGRAVLAGFPPF
ncbi:MAG: DUF4136 domain-containing protein [Halioglobus sp.]